MDRVDALAVSLADGDTPIGRRGMLRRAALILAGGAGLATIAREAEAAPPPGSGPVRCPPGLVACGTECRVVAIDPDHCGACGVSCGGGEACRGGVCIPAPTCVCPPSNGCDAGLTACNGACVDLQTDPQHCGACNTACATGDTCSGGTCQASTGCPSGTTLCNGVCVNLATDVNHCGACNTACPPNATCNAGVCQSGTCPAGWGDCDFNGTCDHDLMTDNSHCGACGNACAAGTTCTGGVCQGA